MRVARTFDGHVDAAGDGLVTIVVDRNQLPRLSEGDRVHVTYTHDDGTPVNRAQMIHELEMLDVELCNYLGPVASDLAIPRRRLLSLLAGLRS